MKLKPKKTNGKLWLNDEDLAAMRMQAIEVAARLPEPQHPSHGMSGFPGSPGKSAAKVIADADLIIGFVTKRWLLP
jgi:hypothetical protein